MQKLLFPIRSHYWKTSHRLLNFFLFVLSPIVRLLSHHSCSVVSMNCCTQTKATTPLFARDILIKCKFEQNTKEMKAFLSLPLSQLLRTEIRTGRFMFGNISSTRGQTAKNATKTLATQATSTRKRPFDNGTSDTSILSTKLT